MKKNKLKLLFEYPRREVYIKVTLLSAFSETPIESQIGTPTEGGINLDGSSGLRRTCNLSFTTSHSQGADYSNWVTNSLFDAAIGLKNFTGVAEEDISSSPLFVDYFFKSNKEEISQLEEEKPNPKEEWPAYIEDNIVWFKQGRYLITSFNASDSIASTSISISGQDKMSRLNGEVSGIIRDLTTNFAEYDEEQEDGSFVTKEIPLDEIVKNLVTIYGGEMANKVKINIEEDDNKAFRLLEYRNEETPLYILFPWDTNGISEEASDLTVFGEWADSEKKRIDSLENYYLPKGIMGTNQNSTSFGWPNSYYAVQKVQYGDLVGYEKLPYLVYPGELKASAGDTITSILDKIKNMFGPYEYFYDVLGNFRFQKKKNYASLNWNWDEEIVEFESPEDISYSFEDRRLFTSYANTPDLKNLKNDFTVWGTKKSAAGNDLPIHMRLALDRKPTSYYSPWQKVNEEEQPAQTGKTYSTNDYDWRELIYQMALDYNKHNKDENFQIESANIEIDENQMVTGRTGYEEYYTDLLGFWRQLYNPAEGEKYKVVPLIEYPEYSEMLWDSKEVSADNVNEVLKSEQIKELYITDKTLNEKENVVGLNKEIFDSIKKNFSVDNENNQWIDLWIKKEDGSYTRLSLEAEFDENTAYYADNIGYKKVTDSYNLLELKFEKPEGYKSLISGEDSIKEENFSIYDCYEKHNDGNFYQIKDIELKDDIYYYQRVVNEEIEYVPLSFSAKSYSSHCPNLYYKHLVTGEFIKLEQNVELDEQSQEQGIRLWLQIGEDLKEIYRWGFSEAAAGNPAVSLFPGGDVQKFDPSVSSFFKDYYNTNKTIYLNVGKSSNEIIQYNSQNHKILTTIRLFGKELEFNSSIYIDVKGQKILYLKYLIQENNEKLEDVYIATEQDVYKSLFQLKSIDRDNLFVKASIVKNGWMLLNEYLPFYKCIKYYDKETNTVVVPHPQVVYFKKFEKRKRVEVGKPEFQYENSYERVDNFGNIVGSMIKKPISFYSSYTDYISSASAEDEKYWYWHKNVFSSPESLIFWFDFIDNESFAAFSIQQAQRRPMVKSEQSVKSIYYNPAPGAICGEGTKLQIPEKFKNDFVTSSRGESAFDAIGRWITDYTYITESLTVNSLPIYGLDVNTKIKVGDAEYFVNKISIPLSYNGTMSINAIKAPILEKKENLGQEQII